MNYNESLGRYFRTKPLYLDETVHKKPYVRKLMEQPWQMTQAGMWDEVTDTLCNLDFIQAKAVAKLTYELVDDFNKVLEVIPENAENVRKERERQARMEKYTQDLISYAKGEIKAEELDIPQCVIPWTEEEKDREIERQKTNPNRLDILKAFNNFLGHEAENMQNFATDFSYFTHQQAWNWAADGPVGKAADKLTYTQHINMLLLVPQKNRPVSNPQPQTIKNLQGHTDRVNSVAFRTDGKVAISGSRDKSLKIWDMESGKCIHTLLGHTDSVNSAALSPDGKMAVSGSGDKSLKVWDVESGECIHTLVGHTDCVNSVALSPDGKTAISGSGDNFLKVWDLESGKFLRTLEGHAGPVLSVALSPDSRLAVSGSDDRTIKIWKLDSGECLGTIKGNNSVDSVALSTDGSLLVYKFWMTLKVWDLKMREYIGKLNGHATMVRSVALSPDGRYAASGADDMLIRIWDIESGKCLRELNGHSANVMSVAFSPDSRRVVSGSSDMSLKLWDLESGNCMDTLRRDEAIMVRSIVLTPDGRQALIGSSTLIEIRDLESGDSLSWLSDHLDDVNSVAVSPDGILAVSGSADKTIKVWDIEKRKCLNTLRGHSECVYSVALSHSGRWVMSGSGDNTIKIWDLENGDNLRTLKGHKRWVISIALSPDGRLAVSGSGDKTLKVWELDSGKCLHTLEGHTDYVFSVAVSSDGRRAVSGSEDKSLKVWELKSGKCLQTLYGHTQCVSSVAFSPDGNRVLSGSWDKTLKVWDMESGKCLSQFTASYAITSVKEFQGSIFGGRNCGGIFILKAGRNLLCPGNGLVTARQIWDFKLHKYLPLSADCPFCGHRFAPDEEIIAAINSKQKNCSFEPGKYESSGKSFISEPDSDLLTDCPNCGEGLVFNPFFAARLDDEPNAVHETTSESLMEVVEYSIRKGYWEAAIAALERLLKLEPDSDIIQSQLAYSKIKALKDNSLPKIAEIDTLIGMIADSGHTGQADELRGLLKKKLNELKPQRKKPWWKRT